LAAALAVVLPATAHPTRAATASKRYRFTFRATAKPSSGLATRRTVQWNSAGSGSFALGPQTRRGTTKTWTIARPHGTVKITWSVNGIVNVVLQADVNGGTYTTRKVRGGLEQTARLKLFLWIAQFQCNFSSTTPATLVLTDLPRRNANQDTVTINVCPGQGVAWKDTTPRPTVRLTPA
jgi:hypothetical protein